MEAINVGILPIVQAIHQGWSCVILRVSPNLTAPSNGLAHLITGFSVRLVNTTRTVFSSNSYSCLYHNFDVGTRLGWKSVGSHSGNVRSKCMHLTAKLMGNRWMKAVLSVTVSCYPPQAVERNSQRYRLQDWFSTFERSMGETRATDRSTPMVSMKFKTGGRTDTTLVERDVGATFPTIMTHITTFDTATRC